MANKAKTFLFGTVLAVYGLLPSCNTEPNQKEPKQPKKEVAPAQKNEDQIVREYYTRVYDSIKTKNGAKSLNEQWEAIPNRYGNQDKIMELEHPYSLGGVMEKDVYSAGSKIIENAYNKITAELAKYNVSLDVVQDSANFYFKRTYVSNYDHRSYETDETVSKYNMCFVGLGDSISRYNMGFIGLDDSISEGGDYYGWEADDAWNRLLEAIYTSINAADYGQPQKDNMKATVDKTAKKAIQDLIAARKSVENKYNPYYLIAEGYRKNLGVCEEGEGCYSYGYSDIDFTNSKYMITKSYVDVYDSKLETEFFGDPNAKYELLSHGNGKWQVVKTSKDGAVSKTHIFEDLKKFSEYTEFGNEPQKIGETKFGFTPGYNYGVRVSFEKVTNVQRRQKDWVAKLPKDVQHTVDSLRQQDEITEMLENEMYKKFKEADSIADKMTREKFGRSW